MGKASPITPPEEAPAHCLCCDFGPFLFLLETPSRKPSLTARACSAARSPHGPRVSRARSVPLALSHSAVLTCPPFTDCAPNPSQVGRWSGEQDQASGSGRTACGCSLQGKVAPRAPPAAAPSASAFPAGTRTGVLTADRGPWFWSRETGSDRGREPPAAPARGLPGRRAGPAVSEGLVARPCLRFFLWSFSS